jgi:hypothetical protein
VLSLIIVFASSERPPVTFVINAVSLYGDIYPINLFRNFPTRSNLLSSFANLSAEGARCAARRKKWAKLERKPSMAKCLRGDARHPSRAGISDAPEGSIGTIIRTISYMTRDFNLATEKAVLLWRRAIELANDTMLPWEDNSFDEVFI